MSAYENIKTLSAIAGSDFTGDICKLVMFEAAGHPPQVELTDAATADPFGVITSEAESGQVCQIQDISSGGYGKVKAGGSITAGQVLIPAAGGLVTGTTKAALADGVTAIGIALTAGDSGDIITFKAQLMERSNDAA
jgi:hypothetical protein